jgi:acylphosphatase
MAAKRFVVRGRVQGVGFRAYAQRIAEELGIAGEVWNRRDGAVELIAEHEEDHALAVLQARLRQGPGRVEAVDVYPNPPTGAVTFEVGPTRF